MKDLYHPMGDQPIEHFPHFLFVYFAMQKFGNYLPLFIVYLFENIRKI